MTDENKTLNEAFKKFDEPNYDYDREGKGTEDLDGDGRIVLLQLEMEKSRI